MKNLTYMRSTLNWRYFIFILKKRNIYRCRYYRFIPFMRCVQMLVLYVCIYTYIKYTHTHTHTHVIWLPYSMNLAYFCLVISIYKFGAKFEINSTYVHIRQSNIKACYTIELLLLMVHTCIVMT